MLPRTINSETGQFGNLYSNLLGYAVSTTLIFYSMTIMAVIRLLVTQPDAERPWGAPGHPLIPALYIAGAAAILASLFVYRSSTTWPGLLIVLAGLPVYVLTKRSNDAARMSG